uniref:Uncharacterized protein n=1 Tax=Candidatus Kentrum sp. FM TaxID=2126340 RepID=A0A450TT28_9GAMM|nr:MAG: hypothetical protein BECKFM1743C_GA0114222_106163 [Candidatus Kentron sp. FM]VFJ76264.1 MAG: hypothetical protein BECKFM1743A_GA0114220_109153 [Candidatus Kentron sp. FM]VFK18378.1 MAG: hypothetical protein BECKFM1743B_GA0114221_105424 [Candidatus Kentron sp. FM]
MYNTTYTNHLYAYDHLFSGQIGLDCYRREIDFHHREPAQLVYFVKTPSRKRDKPLPDCLRGKENATAFYLAIQEVLPNLAESLAMEADRIFAEHWKVGFWKNIDTQNDIRNALDDFLYEKHNRASTFALFTADELDAIVDRVMDAARNNAPDYREIKPKEPGKRSFIVK